MKAVAYLDHPYIYQLVTEEDGGYSASLVEFPGCFAEGGTANEAIEALERAAVAWIEAALSIGQTIPPPLRTHEYNGKVLLRLPKSLHKEAALAAAREGVSLNQWLATAVALALGRLLAPGHLRMEP